MGVSQTLHRISALKNRYGDVCGLTYRIGRHIPGVKLHSTELAVGCVIMNMSQHAHRVQPVSCIIAVLHIAHDRMCCDRGSTGQIHGFWRVK